ncbi:Mfa1 family fimbria major subunit [Bacteroides sp. 51]|uniref:Mfa1 family fimbria major subunit n=1 Tax=Bacteroides sp. 51 TaxID=2302938 RepID=UPI0013D2F722|nr:Mfa1 family fimbria major subunit [Bacteroides sp. 51]
MNFKYVMMACALTLGFASCSNDDEVDNGGIIPNGEPTVARIRLSQSGPDTRATKPTEGNEGKIKNAIIYIFDATAKFEKAVPLTKTEMDNGELVTITTGSHYFYAAVNPDGLTLPTIDEGTSLEEAKKKVLSSLTMAKLTNPAGFFMTNVSDALAKNIVVSEDGSENDIKIEVGRAVAKVNVDLAAGITVTDGTFTDMKYRIGGNPKQMHLFPVYDGGILNTPLRDVAYTDGNYMFSNDSENYIDGATATYATENSAPNTALQGKATHAWVKGVYTPKDMTLVDGNFWRVYDKSEKAWKAGIYASEDDAVNIGNGGSREGVVKYAGGTCYYAFWITDENAAEKYTVSRNNYYDIKIQSVAKIGTNTEEGDKDIDGDPITDPVNPPVKPTDPIEESTKMKVSINVLPWNLVETGVGL